MHNSIFELKKDIIAKASNSSFVHHKWFVKYHLEIVEKISLELSDIYRKANKDLVLVLVWLHDYKKIIASTNEQDASNYLSASSLIARGFSKDFVETILSYLEMIDKKLELNLNLAPIEVKIVSSADAASHLIGPFYYLWWHENSNKTYQELMQDNINKAHKDWKYKMVLPELRQAFKARHEFLLEQSGQLPSSFLDLTN